MKSPVDTIEELFGIQLYWEPRETYRDNGYYFARRGGHDFVVRSGDLGLHVGWVWTIARDGSAGTDASVIEDSRYSFETLEEAKADCARAARELGC